MLEFDSDIVGKCSCDSDLFYSESLKYTYCKNCNERIKLFGLNHVWTED